MCVSPIQSLKAQMAVYDCEWYERSLKFKKLVHIVISRAHHPIILTAGKLYTLSLDSFAKVRQYVLRIKETGTHSNNKSSSPHNPNCRETLYLSLDLIAKVRQYVLRIKETGTHSNNKRKPSVIIDMYQINLCVFVCTFHPEISSFFSKKFPFLFLHFLY